MGTAFDDAQAAFFESMDLFFSDRGQEETRRFIHEAEDARGFLATPL
jgi:hypothetical protein